MREAEGPSTCPGPGGQRRAGGEARTRSTGARHRQLNLFPRRREREGGTRHRSVKKMKTRRRRIDPQSQKGPLAPRRHGAGLSSCADDRGGESVKYSGRRNKSEARPPTQTEKYAGLTFRSEAPSSERFFLFKVEKLIPEEFYRQPRILPWIEATKKSTQGFRIFYSPNTLLKRVKCTSTPQDMTHK